METSPTEQLQSDFSPDAWDGWSYSTNGHTLAYARGGISYVQDESSLEALDARNDAQSRTAQLTPTTNSLVNEGIYVQVHFGREGASAEDRRTLQFNPPVPHDQVVSGEQAPITGKYPRVIFPAEGRFEYAFLFHIGAEAAAKHGLGTKFEEYTVRVHAGARKESLLIPSDCPCDSEVREAIANFHGPGPIPQGEYRVRLEVERMPSVVVRLNGGQPVTAILRHQNEFKPELPVMDLLSSKALSFSFFEDEPSTVRRTPMHRSVSSSTKYVEIGTILPVSEGETGWSVISKVTLRTGEKTEETASLAYVSLRRADSVAEVAQTPNLGLVEMQFSRLARVLSASIDFRPEAIPSPHADAANNRRSFLGGDYGAERSMQHGGDFALRSFSASPAPVNIGRTELVNPKVGPASPTMQAEWDGPITSMRFCLTNAIT